MVIVGELVSPADVSTMLGPLKEAVTPVGAENVSDTGDAKLSSEATYRFTAPDSPCAMDMPVVENATEKSP
jgi:hypothetical protein